MQAISYKMPNIYCYSAPIIDFLADSYYIVQIYCAKSFKINYIMCLYLNFSLEYS